MTEQNKELWRQFTKAWDAGDTGSFGDFAATDVVDHTAMPGLAPGIEGMKQLNAMLLAGFPERSTDVHNVIAEGDRLAALHTVNGTHSGEFMGIPPTGKSFSVNAIHIVRLTNGRIVEHWGLLDQGGMMMQLGLMPMPPGTESWRPPPPGPQVKAGASGDPASSREAMDKGVAALRAGRVDQMLPMVHDDVVDHAAMPGQGPGREGVGWRLQQMFGAMSDPNFTVVAGVGEGPYLAQAYTFTATHTGPMMGMPATNKSFEINALDFVLFEDGKMREHWGLIDMPGMMVQLGLMPPPG